MRPFGLTLAVLGLASAVAFAQSPGLPVAEDATPGREAVVPEPPALDARNQKTLDTLLKLWEDRMSAINGLETKCVLTEISDGRKLIKTGDAALMKPNFARMQLKDPADPGNAKRVVHIVADGKFYCDYQYQQKIVRVLTLPKQGLADNTLLNFLFGMKAVDINRRYYLSVDVEDPKKYNESYVHIGILPKTKADLQEFKKAELVLWKNNKDPKYADLWMLPARLWFQQTNGDQIMWELQNMTTQKKLGAKDFIAPPLPDKEWKPEWIKEPQPEVVRPVGAKR